MQVFKQAWWTPLACLLLLTQLGVALAFIYGDGTSNLFDAESTAAGVSLSLGGACAVAAGLWTRPRRRGLGSALVAIGAALAGIWAWIIFVVPVALAVIVGVVVSQVRSVAPAAETS